MSNIPKYGNDIKVVILSQSAGETVHELADNCANDVGETIFVTGSKFRQSKDNLIMINAPEYNNKSYFSRFRSWLSYFIYTLFILRNIKGKPVLVISSNPPFLPLIGYLYQKFRSWKYIVWVLDVYPDALVQNGLISQTNPVYKMWGSLNRKMYSHAKNIITLGHIMAKKTSKYVDPSHKIEVIPNWVNVKQYRPIPKSENWFAKKHFDLNNLSVIYSGNLGLTHDVNTIFKGIELLQGRKDISFTIIGGGARQEAAISQSKLLTNLKYLPFQPEEILPFSLASADVAIVCLGSGTEGISMPSKSYFSMATGCAILSISEGENDLKHTVEKQNCGINIGNGDIDGFVNAIMKLKNDEVFLKSCKENSRKASLKYFSSAAVIPKYIHMINKLHSNN
jgi:glycosyltransferase involved in cell wall biosynthesis